MGSDVQPAEARHPGLDDPGAERYVAGRGHAAQAGTVGETEGKIRRQKD